MSHIFLSYKREDEARVAPLIQALEREGLPVWSDHALGAGTDWRHQIQGALDAAGCVIVCWTHTSVGPAGDFVRDEASRAKSRGVLIPIKLDKVDPPLGFGEIQALDLSHWKGSARDPFFSDLVVASKALLDGRPAPAPSGPRRRLVRRLSYSTLAGVVGIAALILGLNPFGIQDRACAVSAFQPGMSDMCGALGLGHRPTENERVAWQERAPGSCEELRAHLKRFPTGAYRQRAADLLSSPPRVTQQEVWRPAERRLSMFVGQEGSFDGAAAAKTAALARSRAGAERLCKGFAAATKSRLVSVKPDAQDWDCEPFGSGTTCGFTGEAVCAVEEREIQETTTCPE